MTKTTAQIEAGFLVNPIKLNEATVSKGVLEGLDKRHRQVLGMLVTGTCVDDIADTLKLNVAIVRQYRNRLYAKYRCKKHIELIVAFWEAIDVCNIWDTITHVKGFTHFDCFILNLLAIGVTRKRIAEQLRLNPKTLDVKIDRLRHRIDPTKTHRTAKVLFLWLTAINPWLKDYIVELR